jgi:hypothetical protein
MKAEIAPHAGWERCAKISNGFLELVVTLDVGPRIISLSNPGGENVFKTYEPQLGGKGEAEWMIRGGHRFWIGPEDPVRTYHIDNEPVEHMENLATGEMVFQSEQESGASILKTLGIRLESGAPRATIRHTARNTGKEPVELAPWALSVMRPGGLEIIPLPPLGEHPRDLLPNRNLVLWPYTDLSDPRWHFGREFITLRQAEHCLPAKIGLAHREKWIAYITGDSFFAKSFEFAEGAVYPDGGCNFETFTNSEMLEIESLGPLTVLEPGAETTLVERWALLPIGVEASIESEHELAAWLAPFLRKAEVLG